MKCTARPKNQTVVEPNESIPLIASRIQSFALSRTSIGRMMTKKDGAGDHKPDACKGEWRQVSKTQLDEQPG